MNCPKCGHVFKDPGRVKGGKRSKRKLSTAQARGMVAARGAKKRRYDGWVIK